MRVVVQRVTNASVSVDNEVIGQIGSGLLLFLGIHRDDTIEDIPWMVSKVINLRIFEDQASKMNRSLQDMQGEVLLISQFTLYGNCANGRRPDFLESAPPEKALDLYEKFYVETKKVAPVQKGKFGAHMQISLVNDGPVTFLLDSKSRKSTQ